MRLLLLPLLMAFHFAAAAGTFTIEAELQISGEIDKSAAEKDGWVIFTNDDEEEVYRLVKSVDESKLPFRTTLGDAYISIDKSGSAQVGISVGDADSSCEAVLQWPFENKKPVDIGRPLTVSVSGGDHASGAWNLNGKLILNYKN